MADVSYFVFRDSCTLWGRQGDTGPKMGMARYVCKCIRGTTFKFNVDFINILNNTMTTITNLQKLNNMLSKPQTPILLLGTISITSLSTIQWSLLFLAVTFILDFATGVFASWVEYKNSDQKVSVYLIESKKLRKSLTKAITYMAVVGFVYVFELIFFIKSFKIAFSNADLTITVISIAVCATVEMFSILENSKRCGYDIIEKISTTAQTGWSLFNKVKTGKNE